MMGRVLKGLAAALAVLTSACVAAPTPAEATPTAWVALHKAKGGGAQPPPTAPVADQTFYWGPKTLGVAGGVDPCQSHCVAPVTMAESANFWFDTSQAQGPGSPGLVVPKSDAGHTYNKVRTTPLSGTEDITGCDALARCFTVHNVADRTIAGDYTIRWRDGDYQNSASGTSQMLKAYSVMAYGEEIAIRGGTSFNTINNCGGPVSPVAACQGGSHTLANGTLQYTFACAIGTCLDTSGFTGSNYKVIRPELGSTVTMGPFKFDGQSNNGATHLVGIKFTGFAMDGEASSYLGYMFQGTNGAQNIDFENNTIVGNLDDENGRNRPYGVNGCVDCTNWIVKSNNISYVANGIATPQSIGTQAQSGVGTVAPSDGIYIGYNTLSNISRDGIDLQCMRNVTLEYNVITDKKTAIVALPEDTNHYNPFDSTKQAHGDFTQINMQQDSNNGCVWNYYPGNVIRGNLYIRGLGRDSLPFWTVAGGYIDPNCGAGSSTNGVYVGWACGHPYDHPTPTAGSGSGQGMAMTNGNASGNCTPPSSCRHYLPGGGSVERLYETVFTDPIITDNMLMSEFVCGFCIQAIQGGTVTNNTVVGTHPPASILYNNSWNFGQTTFQIFNIYGTTTTVARNATTGSPQYGVGGQTWTGAGTNITTTMTSLPTWYLDPNAHGAPRTLGEFTAGYSPIHAGLLELDHSTHVTAGALCWDGSTPDASGVCPP
jgi:hypothetical protein